jgi:hypothetical protein
MSGDEPNGEPQAGDTQAGEPAGVPEPAPAAEASGATPSPVPVALVRETSRYTARFAVLYAALGAVLVGAVAGSVVLALRPASSSPVGWSTWRPPAGSTSKMTSEIADHVAHEYHLNKGGTQLVAVVSEPPEVTSGTHKISISNIAVRTTSQAKKPNGTGIQVIPSSGAWVDQLCGLSPSCSIASGHPTILRGRLVRREALEVALYTFKFVPGISSVVAFMPPPPGANASTVLYLQKANFAKQLAEPLSKTLPLARPPLPSAPDSKEAQTIDRLTLPAIYHYSLQQLQDASALLVLNPFST